MESDETKSQLNRFREAARALECDDDEARFAERLKRVAKPDATDEAIKMNAKDFDFITLLGDKSISLHATFTPEHYIVSEPVSGWIAHFSTGGAIVSSDKRMPGIDENALISQLASGDIFTKWMLWKPT
jgi:hypothetical protein